MTLLTGCKVFNLETLCCIIVACVEMDENSVGGWNVSGWYQNATGGGFSSTSFSFHFQVYLTFNLISSIPVVFEIKMATQMVT